ncbi:ABC transporter ATP-binding protein [Micromonospora polyrhachis]|uniref:ATP-binding cassette subfamily B protein n=1 Tax=Micromonospora polyrhachis TaxID=1282883 RepID=A0A7W7WMQ1_9ACTN|nr:ABC transporter ATP-binding protein [Micromonospora polyrhachis]MBB4957050.1 ATP-binding cassette subfamily B protein [Micromonospora polyrhachis]
MSRMGAAIRLLIGIAFRVSPWRSTVVLLLAPLLGAASVAQGLALQWMVDGALRQQVTPLTNGAVLLVVVTVIIHQVTAAAADLRTRLQQQVGLEFDRRLMTFFAGRAGLDHYHDPAFLDAATLLRARRGELGNAFAAVVENLNVLARFVAAAVLLVSTSPVLALLPLVALPLALATRRQERLVAEAEHETAELDRQRRDLFSLASDPAAARELRLYRLTDEIADRHRRAFAAVHRVRENARVRGAVAVMLAWTGFVAALLGGLAITLDGVAVGTASPGEAVLVVVLGTRLTTATTSLTQLIAWLRRSLDTAGLYLRLVGERTAAATGGDRDAPSGDIVFEKVSFTYPGGSSAVLDQVDLCLPAGATVALVGANGAGKSTIVALLAGLYQPTAGRISIGGADLADLPLDRWRSRITACFQDFCQFELLLRETVGLGDVRALPDSSAVATALDLAGAQGLVRNLPAGLDTQLGSALPGGVDLSTGQWQKLALARARMRPDAQLVLLDEPAASLDPDTEAALLARYLHPPQQRRTTTVVVSHRLTTVRAADLIVVLDGGRVVEQGTHDELIEQAGRYAEMYALQAAAYARTSS